LEKEAKDIDNMLDEEQESSGSGNNSDAMEGEIVLISSD
jgi:hypothetical protein